MWSTAGARTMRIKYLNGLKPKVIEPAADRRRARRECRAAEDQYFKGALMLNTLRSVVNDDTKWFALLHGFYQHFKYQNIMTEDVVAYFNQHTGMNLTPIFDQYLRHAAIPRLELMFGEAPGMVMYKWRGGRRRLCDAGARGHAGALADHSADHGMAVDEDAARAKTSSRWRRISITWT